MDSRRHRSALGVLLAAVVVALLPFLAGSVGDIEEFCATAIPMTLAFRALGEGASPFWTPLLGLGMPQPFRISYLMHPLGPAFWLGAETGMNVLTSVHLALGAVATYWLAIRLGVTRPIAVLCAVSAVFSTTITQVLYYDNWFTHVVTWSLFPLSILMFFRLLDAEDRRSAAFYSLALGLVVGFQTSTGLIIRPLIYALLIAPLAVARPAATLRKIGWLAGAALLALVCGANNWAVLFDEASRVAETAVRAQHENYSVADHLWAAFGRPLAILVGADWTDRWSTARVVGFGPVFAALAAIQVFRPAGENARAVAVGLLAAIGYLLLPPSAYFDVVTATWPFRDGVNLYGILLGGVLLNSLRPRMQFALGALQCLLVLAAAGPLWAHNLLRVFAPDAGVTARDLARGGDIIRTLQASAGSPASRVLFAPRFGDSLRSFGPDGIAHNTLAHHGLPVVDVFARGIATSVLHPDRALLEGEIWAGPTTLFDPNLLNVLGITHVLAVARDQYGAGLAPERVMPSRSGEEVHILRNHAAWPRAVFVDPAAAGVRLRRVPGCGHDRFFCADLAPAVESRRAGAPIDVEERHGTVRIRLVPADTVRTVMLSVWYRPGWRSARAGVSVSPIFEQLTAVHVPPGVAEVTLNYLPGIRLWSHVASGVALLAGTGGLLLFRRRRVERG